MIKYLPYQPQFKTRLTELVNGLHREDPAGKPISPEKIELTIQTLTTRPDLGEILLFQKDNDLVGYAFLINFWSNEYGGNILTIDELYIDQAYRNQGIGTDFLNYLRTTKYKNAVALQLETTPDNDRAKKLYQKLGFAPIENDVWVLDL